MSYEDGLEARHTLAPDEVGAFRTLRDSVLTLGEAQAQLSNASVQAAEAKARCSDLSFQMDQLRARLAIMEVEARAENDAAQVRLSLLHTRYDACLEAAAVVVERAAEGVLSTARTE